MREIHEQLGVWLDLIIFKSYLKHGEMFFFFTVGSFQIIDELVVEPPMNETYTAEIKLGIIYRTDRGEK